jgi:hypothetical protein
MYLPQQLVGKRGLPAGQAGASILAALVLVAILGGVLLVFQYVRSSGDFSYEPSSLAAATGEVAKSSPTCDYKTQSCSCASDKTTSSSGTITQQCLPGCQYRVTNNAGASAPVIEAVGTPTTSIDPKNWPGGTPPPGYLQFCGVTGQCSQQMKCQAGGSLSASQLSEIQAQSGVQSILSASTPAAAAQQVSLYTTQGGDLGYLSADLSASPGASGTAVQQASSNIDAANTQIESLSTAPHPVQMAQADIQLNNDLALAKGIDPFDANNPPTAAANPVVGCKTAACIDGNTKNYNPPATFQAPPDAPAPTAPAAKSGFDLGSLGKVGLSFLTGVAQGVSRSLQGQQYVQQMQAAQSAAQQAAAPYGAGTDGYACPPPQPQPSATQCTIGNWQQNYQSNRCPSTWQCVPTNTATTATQPSASISCQPQTADVGMNISISYSCTNATGSTAGGFSTNNQLSGSATAVITAPPVGANIATYGLTCINQSQSQSLTASAQCAVQINQPSIVLIANPSVVATSSTTAIGWVTSGMSACTISSPDSQVFTAANVGNTSVNGVAITPPLTAPLRAVLNCQTIGGSTKTAITTVTIGGNTSSVSSSTAPLSVRSSADNGSVAHGDTITVNWTSINPPTGSSVSLWLVNKLTKTANAVIASTLAVTGVYTWYVPAIGATCNPNASNVCASDLVGGDNYAIEAVMYTPSNAYVGDGTAPSNPIAPVYGQSAVGGTFTLVDNVTGN